MIEPYWQRFEKQVLATEPDIPKEFIPLLRTVYYTGMFNAWLIIGQADNPYTAIADMGHELNAWRNGLGKKETRWA